MAFEQFCPCPPDGTIPAPGTATCVQFLEGAITHILITANDEDAPCLSDFNLTSNSTEGNFLGRLNSLVNNGLPISTTNPNHMYLLCVNQSLDEPTPVTRDIPCLGNKEYPIRLDQSITGTLEFHSKENYALINFLQCNPTVKLSGYLVGGCRFEFFPDGVVASVKASRTADAGSDGANNYNITLTWSGSTQAPECIDLTTVDYPSLGLTNF